MVMFQIGLNSGAIVQYRMLIHEAKELIEKWKADKLPKYVYGQESGVDGVMWAVRTDSIISMNTVNMPPMQQSVLNNPYNGIKFLPGTSGVN